MEASTATTKRGPVETLLGAFADVRGGEAGTALLLMLDVFLQFVVPFYGRLASAVSRQRLISFVKLFFISNLIVFFFLSQSKVGIGTAIGFFVWVGIFNNLVVAQWVANMLLIAGAVLGRTIVLTNVVHQRRRHAPASTNDCGYCLNSRCGFGRRRSRQVPWCRLGHGFEREG